MAIAKNPSSNTPAAKEEKAAAFIAKAGKPEADIGDASANRKPIMIRVPPDLLERIDAEAKRLGISRSAFIVLSSAEKIQRI